VSAGRACIFYTPDLIFIHERNAALTGVQIYIGDGATVARSFIRKRGKALIGHSSVRTQLTWCKKEGVPRAIITHCGSEIVTGDERQIAVKIRGMAAERGVETRIARLKKSERMARTHSTSLPPSPGFGVAGRASCEAPYLCGQTGDQFTQEALDFLGIV
jgi:hypothetical protein